MEYIQLRKFTLKDMGTTKNFCLRNVRKAYGIGAKYVDAKQAMNENKNKGLLHSLSTIPNNCAVPVFTSVGVFGHVMVCDRGTYYSDGKKVSKPNNSYQWGEMLNGVWIVSKDTPKTIAIGDSVIVTGRGTGNSKGGGGTTKLFVNHKMKVINIVNGKYGCNQYNKMGAITGWWNSNQVKKV